MEPKSLFLIAHLLIRLGLPHPFLSPSSQTTRLRPVLRQRNVFRHHPFIRPVYTPTAAFVGLTSRIDPASPPRPLFHALVHIVRSGRATIRGQKLLYVGDANL